jgi:hypothetical protein
MMQLQPIRQIASDANSHWHRVSLGDNIAENALELHEGQFFN